MQTVADGAKQGSVRTGVQIIQNEGVRGLYHGVSIYRGDIRSCFIFTNTDSSFQPD
jgi:dicarboxylate transporter 10